MSKLTSPTIDPGRTKPCSRRALLWATAAFAAAAVLVPTTLAAAQPTPSSQHRHVKPTIVLVHGAWADNSSWSGEVTLLHQRGYPVVVAPNLLQGLSADTAALKDYLATLTGPLVLVGHSYGGAVITDAATGDPNVKALVYDDAYLPDEGQSVASLSGSDSALAAAATDPTSVFTLFPYPGAPAGIYDTYLLPKVFVSALAGDLPRVEAETLAASQTATSLLALGEPSSAPAWRTIPSWDVIGLQDKVIPPAQQLAMAKHAGAHVTEINSSHLSLISHPKQVTDVIIQTAQATS